MKNPPQVITVKFTDKQPAHAQMEFQSQVTKLAQGKRIEFKAGKGYVFGVTGRPEKFRMAFANAAVKKPVLALATA